jgi:ketosteroid isomerase-like protein/RNA polymerase subunit RPABC4/transcription elongation factor Spt4
VGGAHGGERIAVEPSGDRLSAATKHVDDLLGQDKKCKVIIVLLVAATVASFVLAGAQQTEAWIPLGVLCFLGLIPSAIYKGLLHFRLISARNDEVRLLRLISSGNRVCAACRAVLPPGSASCSSCGGDDIRVSGLEDICIPVSSDQASMSGRTKPRKQSPPLRTRLSRAFFVFAIGTVVAIIAGISVAFWPVIKPKASVPDQAFPPAESCPVLETLQVAIGNESGYKENDRYFCIDKTQNVSLLMRDGRLIPLTLESWLHGWPRSGPGSAFVIITNGEFDLKSSEWNSYIAEHPTDPRIKVVAALCKQGIPVQTNEGYENEDTMAGQGGSYQVFTFKNACPSLVQPTEESAMPNLGSTGTSGAVAVPVASAGTSGGATPPENAVQGNDSGTAPAPVQVANEIQPQPSPIERQIRQTLQKLATAVQNNDTVGIANCYAEHVDRFNLEHDWDRKAIRNYWIRLLAGGAVRVIVYSVKNLHIYEANETSASISLVKEVIFTAPSGSNEQLINSQMEFTKQADGSWLISSERDIKSPQ